MSKIERAGNLALFFNFCICVLYILITWDGSGRLTFSLPDELPFVTSQYYDLDIYTIVIIIVVALIAISALVGIQVVGSGLSDSSGKFITAILTKLIVYLVLSIFTFTVLNLIGELGSILYWVLTFFFAMGLIESMFQGNTGGDE